MGDHCWIVAGMARWTEKTDSCFTNCSTQNAFCSGAAIIALLRHRPREKRGVGLRMLTKLEHLLFRSMCETYFCVLFDSRNGRLKPIQSFWYTLYFVEYRLSGAWLRSCGSHKFKENSQGVPPLVSMHTLQETGCFWDATFYATFFHHARLGLFKTIVFDTSFQTCRNMWICRLRFLYRQCVMVIRHVLFFQFGNSLTTCFRDKG